MMPMGGEQMPPMDASPDMSGEEEMQPMDNMMGGSEEGGELPTDFDTNFDAGVEADEETDPKKYIQQLTGKLSQSLNSYNNENGEPDTELGKYVLGMLVKQGTKGMDEKDKKEIIKKINTDNSEDVDMSDDEMLDDEDMDTPQPEDDMPEMEEMPMESKVFNFTKSQIFESFGLAVDDTKSTDVKKEPDTKITPDTQRGRRTKPFEAPKKFKE
jgi:hypothetical protein